MCRLCEHRPTVNNNRHDSNRNDPSWYHGTSDLSTGNGIGCKRFRFVRGPFVQLG